MDAGVRWLHIHPEHLVEDDGWAIVRLANLWKEGVLPEDGGVHNQAAMTAASIEIVLTAWSKMRAEEDKRRRKE